MSKRRAELEVSAGGIVFRRLPEGGARFLLIRDSYDNWGFPKGHLEDGESPAEAAVRETAEETGLERLVLQGPIRVIDWHFRFRGRHIHKYCHFFLLESPEGEPKPQADEGITACQWRTLGEALETLSYDNARGVLKRAGEMVRTLVAVGAGRADRRRDGEAESLRDGEAGSLRDGEVESRRDGEESRREGQVEEEPSQDEESSAPPTLRPSA